MRCFLDKVSNRKLEMLADHYFLHLPLTLFAHGVFSFQPHISTYCRLACMRCFHADQLVAGDDACAIIVGDGGCIAMYRCSGGLQPKSDGLHPSSDGWICVGCHLAVLDGPRGPRRRSFRRLKSPVDPLRRVYRRWPWQLFHQLSLGLFLDRGGPWVGTVGDGWMV